jgi:cytochrome P450
MSTFFLKLLSGDPADRHAPGPGPLDTLKLQYNFVRDQVATFEQITDEYGPVAQFRLGWMHPVFLVTEPDVIEEVLLTHHESFHKDKLTHELDDFLGRGLLTAEDEHWREQRKLVAPNLQRKQIEHYAEVMVDKTEEMLDRWDDADVRKFDQDIMGATLRVVVQTLFDLDLEHRIDQVSAAVDDAMAYFDEITHSLWRFLPNAIPSPKTADYREAREALDEIIYDLIDERRQRDDPGDDLLYRLIEATDDEGRQMTDRELRDEVITLFLAGHETTALAVTYAWFLLAEHPLKARKLHEEVDEVLGDQRAGAADARRLEYTEAVVKEALRMYPPAWAIGREATETVELEDLTIPEGSQVFMSQAVTHRSERFYDNPQRFRPERWLEGLEDQLPRYAYFPFGGGPRICIGNHFAMMEAILIVATIAQHYELENLTEPPLDVFTSITQRPKTHVEMRVSRREPCEDER